MEYLWSSYFYLLNEIIYINKSMVSMHQHYEVSIFPYLKKKWYLAFSKSSQLQIWLISESSNNH